MTHRGYTIVIQPTELELSKIIDSKLHMLIIPHDNKLDTFNALIQSDLLLDHNFKSLATILKEIY